MTAITPPTHGAAPATGSPATGTRRKRSPLTLVGIVALPLALLALLLWGLWDPASRLETVRAAVVNNDEPVTVDGQLVPLGRQLAAELVGSDSERRLAWEVTDADGAEQGLRDGTYTAAVTIPAQFSAAATSFADVDGEARQATVTVASATGGRYVDELVAQAVAAEAADVLGSQLTQTYVDNVLLGFTTLSEQLGGAADGSVQLADGVRELADGTGQLASGAGTFADGTSELADGAEQLAGGVGALAEGASELADGADGLADGTDELAGGLAELRSGARSLSGGAAKLSEGTGGLADGVATLSDGTRDLANGAGQLADGAGELADGAGELAGGITEATDGVGQLAEGAGELASGLGEAVEQIPVYDDASRAALSEVVAAPLATQQAERSPGTPAALAVLALWLGALATFVVLPAVPSRTLGSTRSSAALALRGLRVPAALAAVQGVVVGLVLGFATGGQHLGLVLGAVVVALAFMAANQAAAALFGNLGRAAVLVVAALVVATAVVATVPGTLEDLFTVLPVGQAQAVLAGVMTASGGFGWPVVALFAWAGLAFAATALGVARSRRSLARSVATGPARSAVGLPVAGRGAAA